VVKSKNNIQQVNCYLAVKL